MDLDGIQRYARERGLSHRDASQTFMQVIVLRHLAVPGARLIGGGALVFGHGNPRFSEDIDLTQVPDPL
ncbi:MAG: nucleotidyl transferase AbiEii/AbiGii toxin family protein, partial [Deltaproteobacteria bacterium]|nr:nucleotidyl transferase AbiEii/AbiGii toxin family protein [Deltaproteobacteria bacterium]